LPKPEGWRGEGVPGWKESKAKETLTKLDTQGSSRGSKTGDIGKMADEKPGGNDRLPSSTRSIDDFQKLLLQALPDEPEGKSEGPHEGGFFPVYLHEGTLPLSGLFHRKETVAGPARFQDQARGQALIRSIIPAAKPGIFSRRSCRPFLDPAHVQ
jgi:hypothetical protein